VTFVPVPHWIAVHHPTKQAREAREELRRAVGFSAADEIEKLDRLKKAGSISDAEFARLRAKLVQ
jgi:Short C-terminal domain